MAGNLGPGARATTSPHASDVEAYFADRARFLSVLAGWSVVSMGAGAALWAGGNRFDRYAGIQFVAWGAVDGVIALAGLTRAPAERRNAARDREQFAKERAKFRRLLLVNALADVAYVGAGALLFGLGRSDAVRGTGAGFASQGTFLLAFDAGGVLSFP